MLIPIKSKVRPLNLAFWLPVFPKNKPLYIVFVKPFSYSFKRTLNLNNLLSVSNENIAIISFGVSLKVNSHRFISSVLSILCVIVCNCKPLVSRIVSINLYPMGMVSCNCIGFATRNCTFGSFFAFFASYLL